ncbi:MAG: crossover junction endodeoxyribonuclease RuvC [Candidatus Latescibacterota bacterium]
MRVLGVDPGLGVTGYAVIDSGLGMPKLIEAGVIRSKASLPLEKRLFELFSNFEGIVSEFNPDAMAIEELYSHYAHPKTAVIMGHVRGLFFLLAGKSGIPVYSYSATRIKKSVSGAGHASKEQVASMVATLLNFDVTDSPADVTDAIATAICHLHTVTHGDTQ